MTVKEIEKAVETTKEWYDCFLGTPDTFNDEDRKKVEKYLEDHELNMYVSFWDYTYLLRRR